MTTTQLEKVTQSGGLRGQFPRLSLGIARRSRTGGPTEKINNKEENANGENPNR